MKCPRCQHENPLGAKFCIACATSLARACVQCGTPLPPDARFCPECARPTGESAATRPRFVSLKVYSPKHLAERILTSRAALEGECKQVTVLFADLTGSMELLAARDPGEARALLDPVLEHMMEAVHRYEGSVNQVMGDGIMALFGAPDEIRAKVTGKARAWMPRSRRRSRRCSPCSRCRWKTLPGSGSSRRSGASAPLTL